MSFTLRKYREDTDFEPVYKAFFDYCHKTRAYQVRGCACCLPPEEYKKYLERFVAYPFAVADDKDRIIGMAYPYYWDRSGKYYKIQVKLWEQQKLTKEVLYQTLERLFYPGQTKMIICKVMGYETALLEACRMNGMEQVGCIPDYFCYEGNLFPEYIMMMKYENWLNRK